MQTSVSTIAGMADECGLAIKGQTLYATAATGGHVYSLNLVTNGDGTFGDGQSFLVEGQHGPASIAVDDENVYFASIGDRTDVTNGAVGSVKIGGGLNRGLTLLGGGEPDHLVQGATSLFWIDESTGAIMTVPKNPASPPVKPTTLVSFDTAPPQVLAFAGGRLYYGTVLAIVGLDPDGKNPVTLASDEHGLYPSSIAVDGTNVYWGGGDGIHKVAIAGGDPTLIAIDPSPSTLVVDSTRIHWTNGKNEIWTALK